jgi:hydroxyacylglutathione hydrolase
MRFFVLKKQFLVAFFIVFFIYPFFSLYADTPLSTWDTTNGYKIFQILDGSSNSFVVEFHSNFIMIDTGIKSKWGELQEKLNFIGVNRYNLKALILTHAHYDHVENALNVKKIYGSNIIINIFESNYLKNGKSSPIGIWKVKQSKIKNDLETLIGSFLKYKAVKPDIVFEEKYDLAQIGFNNCWIIRTPGHTIGSTCIVIDNEIVITGDTMVGISNNTLPWYYVNKNDLLLSWKIILDTGSQIFLPAHGIVVKREILFHNYLKRLPKI